MSQPVHQTLDTLSAGMLSAVEEALRSVVDGVLSESDPLRYRPLHEMLAYHMGWSGVGAGPQAQGKRIRPLLVLLSNRALGGNWQTALPAACAVELIHNFSLIHDDIQDRSETRRGRPTLWTRWGIAQAINAGDLMYTLAYASLDRLRRAFSASVVLDLVKRLSETCVELTRGQYLDIAFETAGEFDLEAYWQMVNGKTASLLALSVDAGAALSGCDANSRMAMRSFGAALGLAFQAQDDDLGMWGASAETGKSTASDLVSGKKTLPVIYALQKGGEFARRYTAGPITAEEAPGLASLLLAEGARQFVQDTVDSLTRQALSSLRQARLLDLEAAQALEELAGRLLERKR